MLSVQPPFLQVGGGGGGGSSFQTNFQKGGELDKTLTFIRGLLGKRGVTFFRVGWGGCNFHIKNKLKFEIFNNKKSL